jgi:hypothetical protein
MPFKKKKQIYGDLIKEFRPTIRGLLIEILRQKLFNLKRAKQTIYNPGSVFIPETDKFSYLPLTYLALVQDGTVVELIRVNIEAAKILTSKKTKFIEFDPKETVVKKGMTYLNKVFIESQEDDKKD